ncbi:hypothetical protein TgHK011_006182 [Trichoderma gracile]|nr:hypothetical protein TgHK011_006182 [Trichoderma gracile]
MAAPRIAGLFARQAANKSANDGCLNRQPTLAALLSMRLRWCHGQDALSSLPEVVDLRKRTARGGASTAPFSGWCWRWSGQLERQLVR